MSSSPWRSNYTQNPKLSYEHSLSGFPSQSRRETGIPSNSRRNPISKDRIPEKKIVDTKEDRTPVSCYGCGAPGIIRSISHTFNPVRQKDDALSSSLNQSNFYSFSSESNPISIIQISICSTEAAVCADTGATHSVAGEKLYHLLKQKGLNFEEETMQMTLADGRTQTTEILTTSVDISIQGKVIPTELLILKNARGNRTLLGIDFLTAAGIVLDLQRKQCRRDTYPLPRMDDLLHQAKITLFMSTLDLRAGYHQVKVHVEDQDKTAFVCPFGTYRFLRMPYGLRNAPATFQRLMNRFCNGLEDILALPYLDDIIVLSETFEKHMFDLKTIFERLLHFKLKANREKCHFASSRVKYLGFCITQKGIEVDPEKVASILDIPPPKNVEELQSFLQTCSWFRRYIQDFAKISHPLSYLTKKKVKWQWGFEQQNAFQTLKNSL
ncbi:retrovirus-related Pol polyprotein from transposon opus [Trichonephila clavipes]|nr:retrovirus-related Pol polyprotein from transposon opus [Trichonephila clavipes]